MTAKKMPKKVTVLGVQFTIEYKPDLRASDDDSCFGLTDGAARVITLCTTKNNTPKKMEDTLFHECAHAILYVAGLSELLDGKMEEAVVLAIENGLSPLYRRSF